MNVLCVNSSIDPVTGGGTAERTVKLAVNLKACGIQTSILTTNIGLSRNLGERLSGIEIVALSILNRRYHLPRLNLTTLKKTIRRADIVHLMNHWTAINAIVFAICRQLGKPYVVCPAGALPIFGRSKLIKKMYNLIIGNNILRHASGYIAIPANEAIQFEPYGIAPDKITIIPNGIEPNEFIAKNDRAFRTKYGIGGAPFLLFVGRLNLIKGPDLLLQAFAGISRRFPDHHLVYAGPDGGMLDGLKDTVRQQQIEKRVHFIGFIGGEEKSWAYHAADMLVVPSRQEAMSIVAIEAGITGTPVLITDVCGLDEVSDIQGGIVAPATVEGIQEGLAIIDNPRQLEVMGRNLKRFVRNRFTWDSVANMHIRLFNGILRAA